MAKKALCIGINNYPGTGMDLQGCLNDAHDWAETLTQRGFAVSTLLDAQATKAAMVEGMAQLIGQAQPGDLVVITYSGHGTYVPAMEDDEVDGLDEALCPHDIRSKGALTDDEIHELLLRRQPKVKLVLIADSCHSGTVTRAAPDTDADPRATRPRFMPIGNWMDDAALPRGPGGPLRRLPPVQGRSPLAKLVARRSGDLLLAGCQEGPNPAMT
ncbi:caspase family protein [Azohydromonas caseinilytica]|uniref:Caspase family protein n=1 Tax=Azohydromonas caseinilytica TaxID=2728836 RepID=A0A848F7Y8_9BURK|nr:caspase family protein [Azohydromonas caseinilytica]NML14453.1 caspase family protein [Azohydromonas caseinilytica]